MSLISKNDQINELQVRGEASKNSPYPGLMPYGENDAHLFCGRDTETRLLIANLFATRLTLFYGESGVGKSSVLQAGVVHTLKSRSDVLGVYFNKWKANPCANLKATIAEAAARVVGSDPRFNQTLPLNEYLTLLSKILRRRLFIILDQFEEYFLYHPEGKKDEFFREFPAAVKTQELPAALRDQFPEERSNEVPPGFVISLREDALSLLDRFEGHIPRLYNNHLRIRHLKLKDARSAIVKPLEVYNAQLGEGKRQATLEPALVELVLNELSQKSRESEALAAPLKTEKEHQPEQPVSQEDLPIKAPYVQLVMTRLWTEGARTSPPIMRAATLRKLGGVEKIIDKHLKESMRRLNWSQRRLATRLFSFLVTPAGTKRAYTSDELAALTGASQRRITRILERLSRSDVRILNAYETPVPGSLVTPQNRTQHMNYEIYHDFLAQPVLAWRTRQRLYQRFLITQLFWLLPVFIVAWLWFILPNNLREEIAFHVILWTFIFSIPLAIGFLIGRALERTR